MRGSGKRPGEKDIPEPAVVSGGIWTQFERIAVLYPTQIADARDANLKEETEIEKKGHITSIFMPQVLKNRRTAETCFFFLQT